MKLAVLWVLLASVLVAGCDSKPPPAPAQPQVPPGMRVPPGVNMGDPAQRDAVIRSQQGMQPGR